MDKIIKRNERVLRRSCVKNERWQTPWCHASPQACWGLNFPWLDLPDGRTDNKQQPQEQCNATMLQEGMLIPFVRCGLFIYWPTSSWPTCSSLASHFLSHNMDLQWPGRKQLSWKWIEEKMTNGCWKHWELSWSKGSKCSDWVRKHPCDSLMQLTTSHACSTNSNSPCWMPTKQEECDVQLPIWFE